ncbi:MAG: TIGR00730 family Rossman fold protein [Acidobacteria bacterium]|nr:TIGR00730 family Rossman fold protein [Acidobacteriota bacterium]MCA1610039.1 TIGR00730 family Rossman fold protein [Acidobacteriota bacterium]
MDLRSVCVYCSSSSSRDSVVETEIRLFGREIARRGVRLIYGGSSKGLMGALADEVLAAGGLVTGVVPKALEGREAAHRGLTELKVVLSMHEREQTLFDLADAFVAFPGGFGTMEEIIEMLTWKQLGIHGKPIVLANIGGFFDPLLAQFDLAIRSGYARPEDRILFAVAENTKSILTFLDGAPILSRKAGDWA